MGELVVNILESDDMAELIEVSHAPSAEFARTAVDTQQAQVAIIIPSDFSHQFADHADYRPWHHPHHHEPLHGRDGRRQDRCERLSR